jgi:hypothetical protein
MLSTNGKQADAFGEPAERPVESCAPESGTRGSARERVPTFDVVGPGGDVIALLRRLAEQRLDRYPASPDQEYHRGGVDERHAGPNHLRIGHLEPAPAQSVFYRDTTLDPESVGWRKHPKAG